MSLETFHAADDLYLARGAEVNPRRPIFTGDVFESVAIPGVREGRIAIVVAHPCSMRGPGGELKPSVLVAGVAEHEPIRTSAWTHGFFDLAPLQDLSGTGVHVASFEELGPARSADLAPGHRLACLSPFGVNLLQQRFIWYLTRLEVPTFRLQEAFGHFFEEVDLMEEWIDTLVDGGNEVADATALFDGFIRNDLGEGRTLQKDLRDPQRRSSVRQACVSKAQQILQHP